MNFYSAEIRKFRYFGLETASPLTKRYKPVCVLKTLIFYIEAKNTKFMYIKKIQLI